MKNHYLFFILSVSVVPLHAEIVTDGTLGQVTNLPGADYLISDTLGQQVGRNLFHSFELFNINAGETATFTGSPSVENILARVTGGQHSVINGTLRSDIPDANFYLLNPSGILFGENARLDVMGSFHASTADYLRLGQNGHFSVHDPHQSVLTVAPPEAFGFLTPAAAINIQQSRLRVPAEKTLSVIGGDLQIDNSILFAPSGRINLAAVAGAGEVVPSLTNLTTPQKRGTITLSQFSSQLLGDSANLDVSGLVMNPDGQFSFFGPGGQIFIRAGRFFLNKGAIFADTYQGNGLGIDIVIDGEMHLSNGAIISADNCPNCPQKIDCGASQGGDISVTAQTLRFSGYNPEIDKYPNNLSWIATSNYSAGDGKGVRINTSLLELNPGVIQTATDGAGKAGDIQIEAEQVRLLNCGFINAATYGIGPAGDIRIHATNSLSVMNGSTISASTIPQSTGHGGDIDLVTDQLRLTNVAEISSSSYGTGRPGSIKLSVNSAWLTEGCNILTEATQIGGGNIDFQVHENLFVTDSLITAQAEGNHPKDSGGNINIHSPFFAIFNDQSKISTSGYAGDGGNITINADYFISSADSVLDASSELGIDGDIQINVPNTDLTGSFVLPYQFFAPKQTGNRCEAIVRKDLSGFYLKGRDIHPTAPNDFQTHINPEF